MASYLRITNKDIQELDPSKFKLAEKSLDVFTTFITQKLDNKLGVLRLDLHLERVIKGAELLKIKSPVEKLNILKSCLKKILDRNSSEKIRIIQRASGDLELQIEPYLAAWEKGAEISIKSYQASRTLPEIKHTDFQICNLARTYANEAGADEALLVSQEGVILEGAWSNIFWVDQSQQICSTKNNILPGITRKIISELTDINLGSITLEELINSAEVFITQSTTGITVVNQIDNKKITSGKITQNIIELFNNYTKKNITVIDDL